MRLNVKINGIPALKAKLSDAAIGGALRKGLADGGLIVQEAAQTRVHSPDNPYVGKAGRSVATGRLQASLGTSDVMGSGLDLEVRVGTPYGKGGVAGSTFSRSSRSARKGRTGGRRNTSDVRVYGPIEERKHPFLGPSLDENADRVQKAVENALEGLFR